MSGKAEKYASYLVVGDITCFLLGLLLALIIRAGGWPRLEILELHVVPFALIFLLWVLVFYITGLYESRTVVFREVSTRLLINAQLVNSGIVIVLFYFVPKFLIAPKTVLVIDLIVTLVLLFGWRFFFSKHIISAERELTYISGESVAATELKQILSNPHYGLVVTGNPEQASVIILDMNAVNAHETMKSFYPLLFTNVNFYDLGRVYEEIFGRVPLSLISERWVLENMSLKPKPVYTFLKRAMDVLIALPLALVSLIFYPIVWLAMKIEDNGPLFFIHHRTGERGEVVSLPKFRSMTSNDPDSPPQMSRDRITKVGRVLRSTRIDELPQLWAVVKGKLSLIGPRPEFPHIVDKYKKEIPYYDLRHIIKPGLSGWAQILYNTPAYDSATNAEKLAYDLYYVKNRSFLLDLKIALKTIKTLLSRVGA